MILRNEAEVFNFIHKKALREIQQQTMCLHAINEMKFTFYIGELSRKKNQCIFLIMYDYIKKDTPSVNQFPKGN